MIDALMHEANVEGYVATSHTEIQIFFFHNRFIINPILAAYLTF